MLVMCYLGLECILNILPSYKQREKSYVDLQIN